MIKTKQNGNKVWVTFTVPSEAAMNEVALCGAWNDWAAEPMKQKKNGEFYLTKVLPAGNRFEFGYMINGCDWMPETACGMVPSPFGSHNAVLEL